MSGVDPEWIPVIGEALRWVKEIFASKRQPTVTLDDLSRRVDELAYGNAALAQRQEEILAAVISQLPPDTQIVNHGSILILTETPLIQKGTDDGAAQKQPQTLSHEDEASGPPPSPSLFDGVDEAIANAKLTRPSERE